jgi:transposase
MRDLTLLALDIGAARHAYALERDGRQEAGEVLNQATELRTFLKARQRGGHRVRLLLEATGIYYLEVALLAVELGLEVMVINPKAGHNFARALLQRSKTDRLDAQMLLEFLKRMPFVPWTPPRPTLLALRHYGRHLLQLTEERTATRNRLHALLSSPVSPKALRNDLQRAIRSLDQRIARLQAEARDLVRADAELDAAYHALTSMVGVADTSALALLSELAVLPRSCNSRACVSHAGLDVRLHQSGSSVHKPAHISKHGNKYLRRALFMPALTAGRHDPHARAFRQRLLERGKLKMQANTALMRKLLTAAWALVKNPAPYDGSKLFLTPKES